MDKAQETYTELVLNLFRAGLIQVGNFDSNGQETHIITRLALLPSYPDVLRSIAEELQARLVPNLSRVVCASDAIALGTAVSLQSRLPLIWHTGAQGAASKQFVGAYDIEHLAALVMLNTARYTGDALAQIIREANSVGLQIIQTICLIDDLPKTEQKNSIGLIRLADAVQIVIDAGLVPSALGQKALSEL